MAEDTWTGPAVFLAPALKMKEAKGPGNAYPDLLTAVIISKLSQLPTERKAKCVIVHGTADEVIPLDHSIELSEQTGIRLLKVDDEIHNLEKWA